MLSEFRWETEEWTARLAAMLKNNPLVFPHYHQKQNIHPSSPTQATEPSLHSLFNVLDICTGSGCIPLGLASALPQNSTRLFGVDIHPKAVQLARDNAAHNRDLLNQNPVQFHQADLLAPNAVDQFLSWLSNNSNNKNVSGANPIGGLDKQQRYNLIISNPPYIAHSEYDELEPEVAQWEDPKALLADQEGLVFYPRIANMAMELLDRQIAPYSSLPLSSRVSSSVTNENMDTNDTRELDPGTLERIGPLADNDSQSQGNINNSNDNNSIQQQYKSEDNIERTWRNGPELDRVKIPELVLEIGGDHQVDFVSNAVRQAGFRRVQVWKDLADRARCIVGAR
ncbi:hypothetical protein FBU30_001472 [Linnemannia zychae]|nr:hypothetical protein FBU30_001472 [Linnemannia zychae]